MTRGSDTLPEKAAEPLVVITRVFDAPREHPSRVEMLDRLAETLAN